MCTVSKLLGKLRFSLVVQYAGSITYHANQKRPNMGLSVNAERQDMVQIEGRHVPTGTATAPIIQHDSRYSGGALP